APLHPHYLTSSSTTRTSASTTALSTSVGQIDNNSVAPLPPRPAPVMPAGGADSVSGTSSRPTSPAVRWSSQRHATRSTHSGGSHVSLGCTGTVAPPSASTPQYSTHHSSIRSPAISTRFMRIAAVALAFSYASGQENATLASP